MAEALQSSDLWLFRALTPWHVPWLDRAMTALSISGTGSALWLVLGALALTRAGTPAGVWRLYLTLLLCFITVDLVLKPAIARERPLAIRAYDPPREVPPVPRTLSFPSGHTAASFGGAIALSRVWPGPRVAWWTLAVAMGYSRIYIGHHYPLDVVGGAVVGTLVALWVLGGRSAATYLARAPAAARARGAVVRP